MITSAQCRMARVALKWGVRDLADRANVSTSTITRLEAGDTLKERTIEAVQRALEDADIEFTYGAEPGVRLRSAPSAAQGRRTGTRSPAGEPVRRAVGGAERSGTVTLAGAPIKTRCHVCAFFTSRNDEYELLLPFTKEAIETGDRAVHFLNGIERQERLRRLKKAGIDAKAAERNGRLEFLSWEDAYLRRGRFDQYAMIEVLAEIVEVGQRQGAATTRIWANMEWALAEFSDMRGLIEYESRLNHVLPDYDAALVCSYDLRKFSAPDIADVLRAHPYVVLGGVLSRNPFYVPPEGFLPELEVRGGSEDE